MTSKVYAQAHFTKNQTSHKKQWVQIAQFDTWSSSVFPPNFKNKYALFLMIMYINAINQLQHPNLLDSNKRRQVKLYNEGKTMMGEDWPFFEQPSYTL